MTGPRITVAVASHQRPVRLRWLLDALAEQTLEAEHWEVVVCHDDADEETERLLCGHPLALDGRLRHQRLTAGSGTASRQRNVAWRAGAAPLVAFTDDDCRPAPTWLATLVEAAEANPSCVLQGTTAPDPDEAPLLAQGNHARTQIVDPPTVWAQSCNIAYPRELLERLGGFDESLPVYGEDTDLALRAQELGAPVVAVRAALVHHAVQVLYLPDMLRLAWRWRHVPAVVRRHPSLRAHLPGRIFWRPSHAWLIPALAGVAMSRRRPALIALALPWARAALPRRGPSLRGRARSLSELPARAVLDVSEMAILAWGSLRQRTLFL